nr:glycosyltransferase family 4 protein [Endobacter medicaginis]
MPHRLWQSLPAGARREALAALTSRLAPQPDRRPPACPAGGLAIGGGFSEASGLGESARLLSSACDTLGLPHHDVEIATGRRVRERLPAAMPLLLNLNPAQLGASLLGLRRDALRGRLVVGYFPCELPVPPPSWRHAMRLIHRLWCPSRFAAEAFAPWARGVVDVVPHPVALSPPAPSTLGRAALGWPKETVVVLVSFSLASSFERKNPLAAIAAFRQAFGARPDRLLIIKAGHAAGHDGDLARLREAAAGADNIRIDTVLRSRADAHAMTLASDIVLSLHRSEGFGLVPAEAMLLGRPVVATDWSGTTDFLDASCGVPVPFRLVPARDPRGVFEAPGACWADADVEAAAAALVMLAEDPGLRARLGAAAQAQAQARLDGRGLLDASARIGIMPTVSNTA